MVAVLLGVLVGVAAVTVATGASAPTAPAISSGPANPTAATGATFVFAGPAGATFQCRTDAGAFANCASPKTYGTGTFGGGSHTFQVQTVAGGKTSSATSYTWLIDVTPPTVSSIVRVGASPTNAASLQWTVTLSEPVTGVDATDFALVKAGIAGGSAAVTVSGSGTSYLATMASTGTGDGTVGLNLVDNDSIVDGVGNKLGGAGMGNGSFTGHVYVIDKTGPAIAPAITAGPAQNSFSASTGASFSFSSGEAGVAGYQCKLDSGSFEACSSPRSYPGLAQGGHDFSVRALDAVGNPGPASALRHWTVDTVAPPKPVLTLTPPDPSSSATSKFAWTDSEAGVTFQCSIENGPWTACTTPFTFEAAVTTSSSGQHQFAVRAVDAAGNTSEAATYKWRVDKGSGQDFVINGTVTGLLIGIEKSVPVTINNPNGVPIYVSSITMTLTVTAGSGGCSASNFQATGWTAASTAQEFQVPANATNYAVPAAAQPKLLLKNLPSNQDVCKNKTFSLSFTGSAHS